MKKAYTLMEVLIVVVVIAVIAMFVLPAILTSMPNRNKVYFRKAYASIAQAVYDVTNNKNLYPGSDNVDADFVPVLRTPIVKAGITATYDSIKNSLAKYLGVEDAADLTESTFFCYSVASLMNRIGTQSSLSSVSGGSATEIEIDCGSTGESGTDKTIANFRTVDGSVYYGLNGSFNEGFLGSDMTDGSKYVYIDVDPMGKDYGTFKKFPGNPAGAYAQQTADGVYDNATGKCVGKPGVFRFKITPSGQIIVSGGCEKDYLLDATNVK